MQRIKGYHAHIYVDASTIEQARTLCEDAAKLFPLRMGRVHHQPVGPHPVWSRQLAFHPEYIGVLLPSLVIQPHRLSVLLHPETSHDLKDHTSHAAWLGVKRALNLPHSSCIKSLNMGLIS